MGTTLTKAEIKSIARAAINGDTLDGSANVLAIYNTLKGNRKLIAIAAKKIMPALMVWQAANAAQQGYAQGVPTGEIGLTGAALALARDAACADIVEDIGFNGVLRGLDAIEQRLSPGGFPAGAERIKKRRFGDLLD